MNVKELIQRLADQDAPDGAIVTDEDGAELVDVIITAERTDDGEVPIVELAFEG